MFCQIAEGLDEQTWMFHLRRRDYSRWFRKAIRDEYLAQQTERIELREISHGSRAVISFESWSARATPCRSRRVSPRQAEIYHWSLHAIRPGFRRPAFGAPHRSRRRRSYRASLAARCSRRRPCRYGCKQLRSATNTLLPWAGSGAQFHIRQTPAGGTLRSGVSRTTCKRPRSPAAIERLAERAQWQRLAVMCAEAVPWRCHRSLIADALVTRGIRVEEIISATRTQPHAMTSFARVEGTTVTYPG